MVNNSNNQTSRKKRVTIRDVAAAAGVSVGAASTALRNIKSTVVLSKATRERILQAAKDLKYRPNFAARAMAGQQMRTIGILATEYCMSGSYYSAVLRGIANAVQDAGYHLMLKTVKDELKMQDASIFTEQLMDGVIIPVEAEERTRAALKHFSIPHVFLNAGHVEGNNCVNADERQGMTLGIDHLVELGHRRIAYMHHGTIPNITSSEREKGYLEGLKKHNLEPVPTYDQYLDTAKHVDTYLAMNPRPTAIMCYTDAVGILTCNRLMQQGLRIPEDISVIGNEGVVLHYYAPVELTSIKSPVEELGRIAVEMVLHQINTGNPAESKMLQQEIEILKSTAPPPKNA